MGLVVPDRDEGRDFSGLGRGALLGWGAPMKATATLATDRAPDGTLMVLQRHDGEFYLKVDGVALMSTRAVASEQRMAELACGPDSRRVLIGGLGFGFTLRRVLELVPADAEVEVAELIPFIIDWNRQHLDGVNGALLDDPRTRVHRGDVIDRLAAAPPFDAILMDVDNSPDALVQRKNARLYSRRGLEQVKGALTRGGRVVYWSANRDKAFARELARVFGQIESIPAKAYPEAKRFSHTLFVARKS
jgi:spermidine synthase